MNNIDKYQNFVVANVFLLWWIKTLNKDKEMASKDFKLNLIKTH